jgi:hypothetical protein
MFSKWSSFGFLHRIERECYAVQEERTSSSSRMKNPVQMIAEVVGKERMCRLYGNVKGKCA